MQQKGNVIYTMKRAVFFLVIFLLFGATNALATPFVELTDPKNLILIGTGIISLLIIVRRNN